jgi:two-component SAPR family response regulator
MPILNGFELCSKVRETDKTVQIVFITASEVFFENFRSQRYPELSNIYYIQKPIENEELIKIVNVTIATSSK